MGGKSKRSPVKRFLTPLNRSESSDASPLARSRRSCCFTSSGPHHGAPFSCVLPMAQCSRGIIQSRPFPARTPKVMASAGQMHQTARRQTANDYEREGVVTTSLMASGINFVSIASLGIVKLLGNLEQPPGRNTDRRAGPPGSSQSEHWIDHSLSFMAYGRIPPVANHRRPALPAGNRLSRK